MDCAPTGREHETAVLVAALEDACAGPGGTGTAVLVAGEAGIGKPTVLATVPATLLDAAERRGAVRRGSRRRADRTLRGRGPRA